MVRCAAIAWERQATYQYRQVSYHGEAASEVPSRTEVVDLQEPMSRTNIGTGKAKGPGSRKRRGAGKKDTRKTLTNRRKWTGDEQHNQRMFKEPDSQPPQRDGGETYEPAPLRYMRSARSGPSDDSLSWVVGKKTRAEHSSGPRKQGRSFWDAEL